MIALLLLPFLAVSFEVAHAKEFVRGDGGRLRALQEELSVPGDLSFSVPGDLSIAGVEGGDGLGSKSTKSPTMSSKAGKGKKVDCSFANPIVEQVQYMDERINQAQYGFGLETLLLHAKIVNDGFLKPIVEQRIEGIISDEEIFEQGSSVGVAHQPALETYLPILGEDTSVMFVCSYYNSLWKQMIGTCNYDDWEEEYKSVAALLMEGFVTGLDADVLKLDFLTCTELSLLPPDN